MNDLVRLEGVPYKAFCSLLIPYKIERQGIIVIEYEHKKIYSLLRKILRRKISCSSYNSAMDFNAKVTKFILNALNSKPLLEKRKVVHNGVPYLNYLELMVDLELSDRFIRKKTWKVLDDYAPRDRSKMKELDITVHYLMVSEAIISWLKQKAESPATLRLAKILTDMVLYSQKGLDFNDYIDKWSGELLSSLSSKKAQEEYLSGYKRLKPL